MHLLIRNELLLLLDWLVKLLIILLSLSQDLL